MRVRKKKLPKANYDPGDSAGEKEVRVDSKLSTSEKGKGRKRKLREELSEKFTSRDRKTGDVTKMETSAKTRGTKEKVKETLEVKDKHGRTTMKSRQKTNKRGVTRERGYIVRDGKKERFRGKFKS